MANPVDHLEVGLGGRESGWKGANEDLYSVEERETGSTHMKDMWGSESARLSSIYHLLVLDQTLFLFSAMRSLPTTN